MFEGIALHRSVGYFSTIHPVILEDSGEFIDEEVIRTVDRRLRSAPGRGALFGLMRYLLPQSGLRDQLAVLPMPEIKFNYHGLQPLCGVSCPFQLTGIPAPLALKPEDRRRYLLNLEIFYDQGHLRTSWKYASAVYEEHNIRELAEIYLTTLRGIARFRKVVPVGNTP